MLTLTSPVEIWAHRLPAGPKLAALSLWTLLLFRVSDPTALLAALAAVATLQATGGLAFGCNAQVVRVDLFDFELPSERIALRPVSPRHAARMLVVEAAGLSRVVTHGAQTTLALADHQF